MPAPEPERSDRGPNSSKPEQQVTVETETVPTVPTLGVVTNNNINGTLRIKRSQDSVPRLSTRLGSKKRSQRLAQGSKADIFAAKVANAVDEHDSSGSDETFVYDTPQPATHGGDSTRKPFIRHLSSNTISGTEDAGYTDYNTYDSESETDNNTIPTGKNGIYAATSPIKPEQMPRSPRNFVVHNGAGRRTPSLMEYHQNDLDGQNGYQSSGYQPSGYQPSGYRGAAAPPPLISPFNELDNPLASEMNWPRGRLSRKNSQNRPMVHSESISPIRDPNDSIRAKNLYLQRWRAPNSAANEGPASSDFDERSSLLKARPSLYNYQSMKSSHTRKVSGMGRTSHSNIPFDSTDSNRASHPNTPSNESYENQAYFSNLHDNTSLTTRFMLAASLVMILVLSLIFVVGALLSAERPLKDFDAVSLSDVFVSDRELVFSMITRARNSGLLSITVDKCELDVFATSGYTKCAEHEHSPRTVLLGSIYEFESPLSFHGGLSSATQWRSAPLKLIEPLGNNTKMWSSISGHEFDLTVKGIVSYDILGSEHRETVSRSYHVMSPDFDDDIHQSFNA